ncbi:dienelactone hydrolase family protein [Dyadobacter sp. CY312]|uniref:dienelactone hydrolase family protein n=1 Tax=Dyadobacter sp. CY312 TaxID=2907303 RepID=UPI001F29E78E|nr:dienelactone hydrolase family protein [Dyadobacter sp. CY312]MCE7042553.1 dienelactone hydrolase family protein [Dyadobacter sp. CY312]
MDQRIINLFDEYTHKPLTRDAFLKKLAKLTGSSAAALALLPMLEVNYAQAATISENDDDIITSDITYPGDDSTMKGYLAKPKTKAKKGSVVVIHENRGLNPHTKDVARRIAKAGYIALAVDALAPFGGTPENEDDARALFAKIEAPKNLNNFLKGLEYLRIQPDSNGKTATIGFCWGGALSNQLAVNDPHLNAAIAYYGRQPEAADVPKIKAAVQLHYGGLDERINAGIPAYEEALKTAGKKYELYVYEGAQHAFLNDSAPTRYNPEAAKLAWERTLEFFQKNIS